MLASKTWPPISPVHYTGLLPSMFLGLAGSFNYGDANVQRNSSHCTHILTKILYLINQGEQLGSHEATECVFAMTKLFQSKDDIMRRMVYLAIKELSLIAPWPLKLAMLF